MKKCFLLVVLLLLSLLLSLSACDGTGNITPDGAHTHEYTVKNTDSKYLKSEATVTSPAAYYYSCVCGDIGSIGFFHGETLSAPLQPTYAYVYGGGAYAVTGMTGAGEVLVIPETHNGLPVIEIAQGAFANKYSLTKVVLPDTIQKIGIGAFRSCANLAEIVMPDTLKFIGSGAFEYCLSLIHITVPEGVTMLEGFTFNGCESLLSIVLPESMTNISTEAFSDCFELYCITNHSSLTIEPGKETNGGIALNAIVVYDKDGCKIVAEDFFVDATGNLLCQRTDEGELLLCAYLDSDGKLTLPSLIDGEEYRPFRLRGVTEVVIPDSFTEIPARAFDGCDTLVSVTFPDTLTSIGHYAFDGCTRLATLTFSEDTLLEVIAPYAFRNCKSLSSFVVPQSLIVVGKMAFSNCTSLKTVQIEDLAA